MSATTLLRETAAPARSRDLGVVELMRFLAGPLAYLDGLRTDDRKVVPFRLGAERADLVNHPELLDAALEEEPRPLAADPALAVARTRERAETWTEGRPLDMYAELRSLCRGIAWEALTGTSLQLAPGLLDTLETRPLYPAWLSSGSHSARLDAALTLLIAERRGRDAGDVLSALVGEGGDDAAVRERAHAWLAAGRLHAQLTWTLHLLGRHVGLEARWHEELDAVLGSRAPGADDVARLPFTARALEESARLYPPAWAIVRRLPEPVELGEYAVPAGHLLVLSPWATYRDPRHVDDPLRFDPGRAERPPVLFDLPQAVLILAALGQRWAYRAAGPAPRPSAGAAVEPRRGARKKPVPRP
jgi:cytochrome P450